MEKGDKVVKVELREDDIKTLDMQARERGVPRLYLLREIIERYLAGTGGTKEGLPEDLVRSNAVLEERCRGLETLVSELKTTKSYQEGLITQLMSEQNRLISDGRKPWYNFWTK
jgi:predicted DNA-binding protein